MYQHILLPTDGTEVSAIAVEKGIQFAKSIGASITAFNVMPGYATVEDSDVETAVLRKTQFHERTRKHSHQILDRIKQKAAAAGVTCRYASVRGRAPHDAIVRQGKKLKCDLIIMASHGRKGLSRLFLGSETEKVLIHSKIPVLVVR